MPWFSGTADNATYGLSAPMPVGPFTLEADHAVLGAAGPRGSGDLDVVADPSSGGWLVHTALGPRYDLVVERLDPSLTHTTREFVRLGLSDVEAPSLFWARGQWHLTYSTPACPYCGGAGTR